MRIFFKSVTGQSISFSGHWFGVNLVFKSSVQGSYLTRLRLYHPGLGIFLQFIFGPWIMNRKEPLLNFIGPTQKYCRETCKCTPTFKEYWIPQPQYWSFKKSNQFSPSMKFACYDNFGVSIVILDQILFIWKIQEIKYAIK